MHNFATGVNFARENFLRDVFLSDRGKTVKDASDRLGGCKGSGPTPAPSEQGDHMNK